MLQLYSTDHDITFVQVNYRSPNENDVFKCLVTCLVIDSKGTARDNTKVNLNEMINRVLTLS